VVACSVCHRRTVDQEASLTLYRSKLPFDLILPTGAIEDEHDSNTGARTYDARA